MACLLVGWLDGWMVGWLDGWMVGWLVSQTQARGLVPARHALNSSRKKSLQGKILSFNDILNLKGDILLVLWGFLGRVFLRRGAG